MKLLRDNVLVKQLRKEQLGKIIVPEVVQDEWYRGKVIAVGPGAYFYGKLIKLEIKVGDVVIFPPPMGMAYPTINADGEECIILPEKLIWAVEEEIE